MSGAPSRTALVTGAGSGLGAALAAELAGRGWRVLATYHRRREGLEAPGEAVTPLRMDVTDAASVASGLATVEPAVDSLDLVVCCAGANVSDRFPTAASMGPFEGMEPEAVQDVFRVNVVGSLNVVRLALPLLRRSPDPTIVFVSSDRASLARALTCGGNAYAIAKAGVNMLMRKAARDLAGAATVVAVHPGWVRTRIGGPSATTPAETAARALLDRVERLDPADSGRFIGPDGADVEW